MSRISSAIRSNREGFAIFLAMLLTVLIVLMGVYLIDKLVPASRDVKGVEHGNVAYYKASSAVELALSELSGANPGAQTGSSVG
jgi:type II secretory pathway component PulK